MCNLSRTILVVARVMIFLIFMAIPLNGQSLGSKNIIADFKATEISARSDEAIGIMTKGELCNLTMNYGNITDTRFSEPGNAPTDDFFNFRYPKTKPYGSLSDDFALVFAIEKNSKNNDNGNVIDGYCFNSIEDWISKDGSLGATHYDGSGSYPILTYIDYSTPYLAHSDLIQTWPLDDQGNPFWPGYFRRDYNTGKVYEDEFASDRDVYCVFTDANNYQGDVIGIEIEQMAYCYEKTGAEDFQFYEFFIHNTSGDTVKNAWFGLYNDPDCGDFGQEILIVPEGNTFNDLYPIIMQRDIDGDLNGATEPNTVGRLEDMDFGTIILETPFNLGVTDFHYFHDSGPIDDNELWPIISSQPDDPDIADQASRYFHGSNSRLDDVSLISEGADWAFIFATGPFDLSATDTVKCTIAVVAGDDDADFMKNCEMAIKMYENGFVWVCDTVGVENNTNVQQLPSSCFLFQNYPNPFNPTTTINYQLAMNSKVNLSIYNTTGQLVRTLVNEYQSAGSKSVVWNGLNNGGQKVSSGVYVYQIKTDKFTSAKKMILVK